MPPDDQTSYAPHIPDAVRRASLRADELAREAGVANVPTIEGEVVPPDGGSTTVVTDLPVQPELELQPEPPPAPAPPQTPDWEQRYNTLQGKYNTEIPELRGQLQAMRDLIASMQTAPRAEPQPPTRETRFDLPAREVPKEDVENYGQDLVQGVQRWSKIAVEPEISQLKARIAQLEGGMQQQAAMTAGQRVELALDHAIPNWREVNVDQSFIAWLQQVDPFSGQLRKKLIDEAYGLGDAARTIAFFQAYVNEHTAVRQPLGTQPPQTGEPAERLPLVDLAVPGRGPVAAPPTPGAPQRRIWTGADITAFYRAKQRGQWAGRDAEAERIEQDIYAAQREGRIRQ